MGWFLDFTNVLRFPYMVFNNGGAAFLIPYLSSLVVVIIPLFTLETAWGQLVKSR